MGTDASFAGDLGKVITRTAAWGMVVSVKIKIDIEE